MQQFKAKMLKDGLNEAEADAFVKQARANGSIASVWDAATEYAKQKDRSALNATLCALNGEHSR